MPTLDELVTSPALGSLLRYVVRPDDSPVVDAVTILEDLTELPTVGSGTLVLLTAGASKPAATYRLDVAMRVARANGVGGIVLSDAGQITRTAASVAQRGGVAILRTSHEANLADLAIGVSRELYGAADVALLRAHTALRRVMSSPADAKPEAMVDIASRALGVSLHLGDRPEDGLAVPVTVDQQVEGWLSAPPHPRGDMALACELVLHTTAAAVATMLTAARRVDELPIQSRAEVLTELLAVAPQETPPLIHRARSLAIPIDGWHVVAHIAFENASELAGASEVHAYEARQAVYRTALQQARALGGTWHSARSGTTFVLIRMYHEDPGAAAVGQVVAQVDRAIQRAAQRIPGATLRCGVGAVHVGPAGLTASAAEARAATAAARAANKINKAVAFDSTGLRRTLVEWYASATAREAVNTVLAPLDKLGGRKAQQAVLTLQTYLDRQGSLARTAEVLNLHRNAVSYRINRIFEQLDVDRDNPDDLLLLQLACRARNLS